MVFKNVRDLILSEEICRRELGETPSFALNTNLEVESMIEAQIEAYQNQDGASLDLRRKRLVGIAARMSFWLDKESGKKCFMLAGRELTIIRSSTPMYWAWISLPQSRFSEVANLKLLWWLEINGKMNTCILSPRTNYVVYLVFQRTDRFHGFEGNPIEASIGIVSGQTTKQVIYLDPEHDTNPNSARLDGWYEVELGEFEGREGEELEMSIMEVKTGNAKYGLLIEGIEIRPKFCS
ncbi:hypothetical protein PVL29_004829 [Vitis rotundifolia]|uniref:F-box protein PP2-B12 n=1 Tax=Vitis rotundifolia TaxID=103349 RepID=A0AA39A8Y7_VITRO|nr:hypothetical protein PVL29_004829 [Vitis rotundifolia]